jgi:hypothetical protein
MARQQYELTDKEWLIIERLLPNKPRDVPRVDDQQVLNGICQRHCNFPLNGQSKTPHFAAFGFRVPALGRLRSSVDGPGGAVRSALAA